jgi:D-3-phosphoglycerate dehydrogenase / 2-oxoglutarate reductase
MALSELTHVWVEAPFLSAALEQFPPHVTLLYPPPKPADPIANAEPVQAVLASSLLKYDGKLMDRLPNLRLIARTGIGYDNVNVADATARGIVVCNTPDGPTQSTAEHTVAMLLAVAKRLKQGNANLAAGKWGPREHPLVGTEVKGKTLGLVGLGRIGRKVGQICRLGLEMNVVAYDPFVTPEQAAELGITWAELDSVVEQADFLSVHVPASPETYHLVNRKRIARMKTGAYVLNMARGPLVDAEALLEAVDSGKLAGAGIDVFEPEPPPVDSRLRNHPMILATPHTAGLTEDGRSRIEFMAVERVLAFFRGERPPDVVNRELFDE